MSVDEDERWVLTQDQRDAIGLAVKFPQFLPARPAEWTPPPIKSWWDGIESVVMMEYDAAQVVADAVAKLNAMEEAVVTETVVAWLRNHGWTVERTVDRA